jgi:hypothetical protein
MFPGLLDLCFGNPKFADVSPTSGIFRILNTLVIKDENDLD